jgi:hypothetical protein
MEYAIAAGIIVLFLILNILTQPKLREAASRTLSASEYSEQAVMFTAKLPLPKESGAVLFTSRFKRMINRTATALAVSKKSKISEEFNLLFKSRKADLKKLKKTKFTPLENLPAIGNEARIVKIARFSLAHSDYIFSADRIEEIISEQNGFRTLNIYEVLALRLAYRYVILEKLSFLSKNILSMIKIERLAKKYARHSDTFQKTPIYHELRHNKLFLEICAEQKDYHSKPVYENFDSTVDRLKFLFENCFSSLESAEYYDFTRHYGALKLLSDFKVFENADNSTKIGFLKTLSALSDKENLDEYLYAKRLVGFSKYYKPFSNAFQKAPRSFSADVMGRKLAFSAPKRDLRLLSVALSDDAYMNLFFAGNKRKKQKLDAADKRAVFAPFYKNYTLDFGIAINDGHLKVKPYFPEDVEEITVKFKYKGMEQQLKIKQSMAEEVRLGGTLLHGVSDIYLGDSLPHEIEISMPFEKAVRNKPAENAVISKNTD